MMKMKAAAVVLDDPAESYCGRESGEFGQSNGF
jgi:hypothetical protein